MQVDQRYIQTIQNQNAMLRQQIGRLNGFSKTLDQKYQKALKEMSSIIHANQNLKTQLDNLKINVKDQIQNSIRQIRINYEKRLEQMILEKNDIYIVNQNLVREKQQLQRDYSNIERNLWETQALKNEISNLKKQNEKLLLQTHPLTQNKDNPQQKNLQQKFSKKIDELNMKIIQLNYQSTQSKKIAELAQSEKLNLQRQNQNLQKKIIQLNSALQKISSESHRQQKNEQQAKFSQAKRYQIQILDLRKLNANLTNQIEKLKLQNLQKASEINKNEAQLHLLSTLKSLHAQLEPMRYQIQQLKRDKYFDRQNTNKQKADLQIKLLSSQHQIQTLKKLLKDLQNRNKDLNQQIREKKWQKHRFQQIEEQKRMLQGRVIVYEAMEMVSRNRDKPHHIERIQQFERRIQLLLEQQNLQYLVNNANVHQLIAMKAYVIELDNKLQMVIEQNEHFHKKYGQYKDKYKQLIVENKQVINKHYSMINAYKGKIAGYQKLVMKLTQELEKYIKQTQGPSGIQSHYKSVITLYESKILSIHNELNAKKQDHRDLLNKYDNLQLELKGKLALIRQIETQLSKIKAKNNQLNNKLVTKGIEQQSRNSFNNIPEQHYKNIITQKTKEILELQQNLSKLRFKMDKIQFEHDRDLQNYKHKINRLQIQIEQLRLQQSETNKQLSTAKHSEEFGQLVSKLSNLQKNVAAMSKSQVIIQHPHQSLDGFTDLNRQNQILKRQNQNLIQELQNYKRQLKEKFNTQNLIKTQYQINNEQQISRVKDSAYKTILDLQNKINQLDTQLKIKNKEIQIKQKQYSRILQQSHINMKSNNNYSFQQQNKRLRDELQRIRLNSKAMAQQSEGLMVKIRQTQAYISNLKVQFNNVSYKMGEYQRELNVRDHHINQWKLKYKNLQQKHQIQLKNMTSSIKLTNDKQNQEKLRKTKEAELEVERSHRQIQSKRRDIQRRQIQVGRRQSQIDSKNRDYKDRLRKMQDRQNIISEQQIRLTNWKRQLQQNQKKIKQMLNYPAKINETPPKSTPINFQQQFYVLERKVKILQIDLAQKIKIVQIKDEKMNKIIRQKVQLVKQFQDLKVNHQEKTRQFEINEKQVISLKQQYARLEGQLQKLWKQFDSLKQQIRIKQRELTQAKFQKQQSQRKLDIQIKQLNLKLKQFQYSRVSASSVDNLQKSASDYNKLQNQFQQKLLQIQQRNRQKMKQIYRQNDENMRQLYQKINDLNTELNRNKFNSPFSNKNQIQSHTAAIQSLESHIKILEQQIRRKQSINIQLEEDINYYKNTLSQREQEIKKLYQSSYAQSANVPSTSRELDNLERIRLQNQIISLQTIIKNKGNQDENHQQCIKKQHVLRMEIQRLNGMLQSKISQQNSARPQSPKSNNLNSSYLNELQQTNRNLQEDLTLFKQRLLAEFDEKRNIEDYLSILVITFVEVDALRQRIYQMQENFKQQHQRQINAFKQLDDLKQHNIDVQKVIGILKQLQASHRFFHEQQQRSKGSLIKKINTQVLVMPGSQSISINDQINKLKNQNEQHKQNANEIPDSTKKLTSMQFNKFDESNLNKNSQNQMQQKSINLSLNQQSRKFNLQNNPGNTQLYYSSLSKSNLNGLVNTSFYAPQSIPNTSFNMSLSGPTNVSFTSASYNQNGRKFTNKNTNQINFNRFGESQGQKRVQFGGLSNPQFSSTFNPLNRPNNLLLINQTPIHSSSTIKYADPVSYRRQQISPQNVQPYHFYQYSETSQSSIKFPSQTNIINPVPVTFGSLDNSNTPYIMSNNQLMR